MERKSFNANFGELSGKFRDLAENGYNGFDIMAKLDISARQADKLHTTLLKAGKISPAIKLEFTQIGMPEVAARGNIFITRHRIMQMGLEHLFRPDAKLKIERAGDGIFIKAMPKEAEAKKPATSGDGRIVTRVRKKASLWERFFSQKPDRHNS